MFLALMLTMASLAPKTSVAEIDLAPLQPGIHALELIPPAPHTLLAPPRQPRWALTITAATLTTLASMATAAIAGWSIPTWCFRHNGRPQLACESAGLIVGSAVQIGLAFAVIPNVFRLANDADGFGTVSSTRALQWRWARWAMLAAGVFVTTYIAGAIADRRNYGSGQYLMWVGAAGIPLSWIAFDVVQLLGAARGYTSSRQVR